MKIERLRDKDNWHLWSFMVRTLLEEDDDVLAVCEGKLTCSAEDSQEPNKERDKKRYLKADKTARRIIIHSIERRPMELIVSCTSAREMWVKLNSVYDMKSEENLTAIQKLFYEYKWIDGESVDYNISKIEMLWIKMKNLGSVVPESMLMSRILTSLPQKFNYFHSAWDSVEDSKRTLENLTTRLMSEELRLKSQDDVRDESAALIAGNQKSNFQHKQHKNESENKRQEVKCYNCGISGHLKKRLFQVLHM